MFRVYTVAVYFRGGRLAKAQGHSIQQAEMNAAKLALETCGHLFPHLNYQKRIMEKSFKKQGVYTETIRETWYKETLRKRQELGLDTGTAAKEEQEDDVKQEVKDEMSEISDYIPESDSIEDVAKDDDSETLPEVPEELGDNDTLEPEKEKNVVSTQEDQSHDVPKEPVVKNSNKEAVRAEIREIEEKLRKKKQKKVAEAAVVAAACDLEDGECVDSEEDFDDDKQVGHGSKPAPTLPTPPEDKTKKREDNRKRWNEGRRSSSSSHQERSREGGERRSKDGKRHEGGGGERYGRHEGERGRQGRHDRERRDRDRGYYDQYEQRQYRH